MQKGDGGAGAVLPEPVVSPDLFILYLYDRRTTLPVPVVWSLSGPVPGVGELIFVLIQSKSSVDSWKKPHKSVSKVQFRSTT